MSHRISFCRLSMILGAGLGWIAVSPHPALAESPELVTDRPDQTESAVVVPPGSVQLEVGWTFTRDEEGGVRVDSHEVPGTLVRVGLSDRVELRLGWAGTISEQATFRSFESDVDGSGDGELGAKIHLRSENGRSPEMALLVATSVPIGGEPFTSDRFDPSFRLSLSHTLSERLSLGYNLGMAWASEPAADGGRTTLSSYLYTVALGIGVNDRLGAFVELYGDLPGSAPEVPANSFDGGFTYQLRDNLQLDLAAGVGLSEAAADWFVGLGLSVRWPR